MKTNRRRLIQLAGATTATIGASGLLGAHPAGAQGAGELDILRIATTSLPPQLDPQVDAWIAMTRIYPIIFDTLLKVDWENAELVPALATSWNQVDDVTLDVQLRDDVVFQDGTPMTSADVKYTFDRSLLGDASLQVNGVYLLSEVIAVDDYTVRFVTERPFGGFLQLLADWSSSIVPAAYHAEVGEEFAMAPIGTGPYQLTNFALDSQIDFTRNDQYWGGLPAARSLRVVGIPEVSTRIASLLNGEADLILDLSPDQIATVENGGDFTIESSTPANVNVLDCIGFNAPVDKKEVRQALSLGIDRELVVSELLLGNGLVPGSLQSILDPLYIERPPLEYNPERARELLAQAGYAGEEISFVVDSPSYYPLEQEYCSAIIAMWSEIGVNAKQVNLGVNERVAVTVPDSPHHVISDSYPVFADTGISLFFGSDDTFTTSLFPAGTLTGIIDLVNEAQSTVDPQARAELYSQVVDALNEEMPNIPLWTINRISAMTPNITWAGSPDFGIDLRPENFSVA